MYYEQAQAIMDDNMSQEDRKQFPDYDLLRKELLKFLELSDHINVCIFFAVVGGGGGRREMRKNCSANIINLTPEQTCAQRSIGTSKHRDSI